MSKKPFESYALLGSGRLARHLHFYLKSLNLPLLMWSRDNDPRFNSFQDVDGDERLAKVLDAGTHVLLAVKDAAIPELSARVSPVHTAVHFSGALRVPFVNSCHPLMTFGEEIEQLEWYRSIPFVIDEGADFGELLPGLPNPHFTLNPSRRSYYHALCSLAGNSTFLLWQQIGDEFERNLGLPRGLLAPFLHQVVANSSRYNEANFTGPVARGDWDVVKAHLDSLHQRPELLQAYKNYLQMAGQTGHPVPEALL
jgi:predicted short-subunit dehydrogenase-like oxidoreductase (DUF2520 family)